MGGRERERCHKYHIPILDSLHVVATSKSDYTKLTLNQAKRLEMESQVRALELEKDLEMERTRLAELRKIHYHLGGAGEGWDEVSV